MCEIVVFDGSNGQCLLFIKSILGGRDQARNASFKTPPGIGIGLRGGPAEFLLVISHNGLPIRMAHRCRDHGDVLLPLFGKDMRDTSLAIEPGIGCPITEANGAQKQSGYMLRIGFGIEQS